MTRTCMCAYVYVRVYVHVTTAPPSLVSLDPSSRRVSERSEASIVTHAWRTTHELREPVFALLDIWAQMYGFRLALRERDA